jgi:ribonuclease P protein component
MTVVSDLSGHPVPRFAVLVGKRVDKRASRRNRMKRLVRESVRLLLPAIGPGCDAIFLVNANIAQMTIGEVSSEVRNLLKDIGAIRTDL